MLIVYGIAGIPGIINNVEYLWKNAQGNVDKMWKTYVQTAQIHENQSHVKEAAFGRRPPFVDSFIWAREAEDIAKTYANMY